MNKLLFLGTGAADWNIAEKSKADFFRRYSAAMLNGNLLIDCGPHIFDFEQSFEKENLYENVSNIIITHKHSDHFCLETVLKLAEKRKIRVGCDEAVARQIGENPNIEFVIFKPYEAKNVGEYKVIPLLANHDIVADGNNYSFHYIIETSDGKKIFYGLDGAWFLRSSWEEMKKHKYDIMVFDCTVGDKDDWRAFEHNTIPMLRIMLKEVRNNKLTVSDGKLIASHMARTLHGSHKQTQSILSEIGMLTAYDGFEVMF